MEKEELTAILEQVKATARETINALKAEEQQTTESLAKEKRAEETLAEIKQLTGKISSLETRTVATDDRIKNVCETFPGLCEKVEALAKKLETPPPVTPPPTEPPKPEEKKKKGILDTGHDAIEDLLSCPECLLGHIKKIGFDKAAEEICKDDESCKATIAELTKKGYKIEEPKKEEPKKEETSEGKDEEGKEGDGSFSLGKGEEGAPAD